MREDGGKGNDIETEEGTVENMLLDMVGDERRQELTHLREAMDEEDGNVVSTDRRSTVQLSLPILVDELYIYIYIWHGTFKTCFNCISSYISRAVCLRFGTSEVLKIIIWMEFLTGDLFRLNFDNDDELFKKKMN